MVMRRDEEVDEAIVDALKKFPDHVDMQSCTVKHPKLPLTLYLVHRRGYYEVEVSMRASKLAQLFARRDYSRPPYSTVTRQYLKRYDHKTAVGVLYYTIKWFLELPEESLTD